MYLVPLDVGPGAGLRGVVVLIASLPPVWVLSDTYVVDGLVAPPTEVMAMDLTLTGFGAVVTQNTSGIIHGKFHEDS
uniref:Uncharacterized protein n=1 Tax=Ciona savignyi TaxID=51511 RepID=H2Z392_CIOSA